MKIMVYEIPGKERQQQRHAACVPSAFLYFIVNAALLESLINELVVLIILIL
jgi:hypothetical protein